MVIDWATTKDIFVCAGIVATVAAIVFTTVKRSVRQEKSDSLEVAKQEIDIWKSRVATLEEESKTRSVKITDLEKIVASLSGKLETYEKFYDPVAMQQLMTHSTKQIIEAFSGHARNVEELLAKLLGEKFNGTE